MHPSCASRFLPVTSSCLAFYLGQTGIRLNALIKLLTWFGRPGGHRVSADELDLFCLCLPPPRSSEGGIDQGCATTRDRSGAPRLLVPLSHAPSPTPSAPDRDSNPYFTFDDVSDDERLSHRRSGLFAADLTTSRADLVSHTPFLSARKENRTRGRVVQGCNRLQALASWLTMDISGRRNIGALPTFTTRLRGVGRIEKTRRDFVVPPRFGSKGIGLQARIFSCVHVLASRLLLIEGGKRKGSGANYRGR